MQSGKRAASEDVQHIAVMDMVWTPSSCCGINRRKAGYIIASITAICNMVSMGNVIFFLPNKNNVDDFCNNFLFNCHDYFKESYFKYFCFRISTNCPDHLYLGASIPLGMGLLLIVSSFFLIHGIRKKMPDLMIPYMVMMGIAIALLILGSAILVIMTIMAINDLYGLALALLLGTVTFIMTFFNLVVRAHYIEVSQTIKNDYKPMKT
ncbi:uncharacterized protein LOC122244413 [Penaeus japonicus]|uniref:uncharacterized protein LOC122244413 n=1 Tax=Penaeus japonicus TaxID=27405 RepID=UPI001C716B5F|nr:uncharacterized protein LOC122244413 [Penaeus japonicus]